VATIQRTQPRTALDADRLLLAAVWIFTAAVLLHNSDHVRRGADAVATDVFWAGSLSIPLEVAVVAVVILGHRVAPLFAATTGFSLAAGYILVHLLPGRSWLSDPLFSDGGAELQSQLAASIEIVAALALGAAGLLALRQRGGLASAGTGATTGTWSKVLTHPAVLAMALGNAVVFILSIVDR
jgi:hypothetical protein